MNRLRWWMHKHGATLSYLFILAIVAAFFVIALLEKGGW